MAARAALKPPPGLKSDAIARWRTVAPMLARRGAIDRDLLATYCQVYVRWRQAEEAIARTGQLVKNRSGRAVASPLIAIANQTATQVRSLEQRLGLAAAAEAEPPASDVQPTSPLLTRRELAAALLVHMQTVTKWERDGLPIARVGRKGKPSRYREADVRGWLAAREAAAKADPARVDVAQERARKERAQAVLAEQTFQSRSRELLPAAEVERIWAAEVQAVRTAVLATYTTQADRLHRTAVLEGVAGVEAALRDLAHELLRELASPDRALPDTPPSAGNGQAA